MKYTITKNPDSTTLNVSGRLDTLAATELENGIAELAANPGASLTVEVPDLTYISSSGLRCFVRLYNGCKKAGVPMNVVGVQPAVKEIFDMTGFSKIFGL